mgnify:CR=1 FL=1
MGLKRTSYWLKGVIIALSFSIIILIANILLDAASGSNPFRNEWNMILYYMINFPVVVFFDKLNIEFNIFYFILSSLVFYFILGAVIGLIYGKLKNRN